MDNLNLSVNELKHLHYLNLNDIPITINYIIKADNPSLYYLYDGPFKYNHNNNRIKLICEYDAINLFLCIINNEIIVSPHDNVSKVNFNEDHYKMSNYICKAIAHNNPKRILSYMYKNININNFLFDKETLLIFIQQSSLYLPYILKNINIYEIITFDKLFEIAITNYYTFKTLINENYITISLCKTHKYLNILINYLCQIDVNYIDYRLISFVNKNIVDLFKNNAFLLNYKHNKNFMKKYYKKYIFSYRQTKDEYIKNIIIYSKISSKILIKFIKNYNIKI